VPNNYYDGLGYDNAALIPQFLPFALAVRDSVGAGKTGSNTNLHICLFCPSTKFTKSFATKGGFAFLGLAETIKYVAGSVSTRAGKFVFSFGGEWAGTPSQVNGLNYSTNTVTNVDLLLRSIRDATGFTGSFTSWTQSSVLETESRETDVFALRDCIFGPGLPSHKDTLGNDRFPYFNILSSVKIRQSNLYFRGNTTITSAGIGCNSGIENSGSLHYGSALQNAPWTFRQFHHTIWGSMASNAVAPNITLNFDSFGDGLAVAATSTEATGRANFYADLTGKLLPNHLHLLTNGTSSSQLAYPSNDNDGPFVDQYIHAKTSVNLSNIFPDGYAGFATIPVRQGWMGRFGSNGHNATKSRGVLLGCIHFSLEGGEVLLTGNLSGIGTIWNKAGTVSPTALPVSVGSASYGEASPAGDNPVITTKDNGSTELGLNLGGRSWRRGISPQYGSNIKPTNLAL
jgi:hypothetical protein